MPTTTTRPLDVRSFYSSTIALGSEVDVSRLESKIQELIQKAQVDFRETEEQLNAILNDTDASLNIYVVVSLVRKCMDLGSVQAAEAAERFVFEWMMQFSRQQRLSEPPKPNLFGMAMQAWVLSAHPSSGKRAEQQLNRVEAWSREGALSFAPNTPLYTTVMKAYAIHGDLENVQAIFDRCKTAFEGGNEDARPDGFCWNARMDAWAKSGRLDAWQEAETVFTEMQQCHREGALKDPPDSVTYTCLIEACAKSNRPQRAGYWLEEMLRDRLQSGTQRTAALPALDLRCFLGVINAWARVQQDVSGERAEMVLECVERLHEDGFLTEGPNVYIYSAVIHTWATLGQPERATQILDRMLRDYRRGNQNAKPNLATFSSLIQAYRNAKLPDAGPKADLLLQRLEDFRVRPDRGCLVAVILCWEISKMQGDPRAEKRLKELQGLIDRHKASPGGKRFRG